MGASKAPPKTGRHRLEVDADTGRRTGGSFSISNVTLVVLDGQQEQRLVGGEGIVGRRDAAARDARHVRDPVDHRGAIGRPQTGQSFQACRAEERGTTSPARERDPEENVAVRYRGQARSDHVRALHPDRGRAGAPRQNERADEPESATYRHRWCFTK